MRFEQLEYLIAIDETGSFKAAAQKLYITQQALSLSMRQLEDELGKILFIKKNNKTYLTAEGKFLLGHANKILNEKNIIIDHFHKNPEDKMPLQIHILSTSSVLKALLPSLIAQYEKSNQRLMLKITEAETTKYILERLVNEQCGMGLICIEKQYFERLQDAYSDVLQAEVLGYDELVGVINNKFYDGTFEVIDGTSYNSSLRTIYNVEITEDWQVEAELKTILWSNDIEFHKAMLEQKGSMVSMTRLSFEFFLNSKKYVALPLKDQTFSIVYAVVYRKDAEKRFLDFVQLIRKELYSK